MPDDDARDERIRAALEVEPLDDVTRRRLVSTALAATADDSSASVTTTKSLAARWIAAAAAIVVVLVVAFALITAPGGNDEQQASTPPRSPVAEQKAAGDTASSSAPQAGTPSAGSAFSPAAVNVGDFGDLNVPANLARLRTALEADRAAASANAASSLSPLSASTELDALPCRADLPAGTVKAVGTGTLDGRRAVVVLTTRPDGSRTIDAVLASPCQVRRLS
jgi:hypothetical protein